MVVPQHQAQPPNPKRAAALSSRATRFPSAWREHLDVKLDNLEVEASRLQDSDETDLAQHHLTRAREAVNRETSGWNAIAGAWSGIDVERAWVSTHAAQVSILRASTDQEATDRLPSLLAECTPLLPAKDERIAELAAALKAAAPLTAPQHTVAADTLEAAYQASDAAHVRVRSFRNILIVTTVVLALLAVLIGLIAGIAPDAFAVCDSVAAKATSACPSGGHSPSGGDVFLVEVLGLAGAAITAAVSIRNLQGTSTPYAVPLVALLLKLPTGAITALLGVLLLRAGFVSSIATLSHTQVIAYALVFGASQQLFLQFVDKQANVVLGGVGKAQ